MNLFFLLEISRFYVYLSSLNAFPNTLKMLTLYCYVYLTWTTDGVLKLRNDREKNINQRLFIFITLKSCPSSETFSVTQTGHVITGSTVSTMSYTLLNTIDLVQSILCVKK